MECLVDDSGEIEILVKVSSFVVGMTLIQAYIDVQSPEFCQVGAASLSPIYPLILLIYFSTFSFYHYDS